MSEDNQKKKSKKNLKLIIFGIIALVVAFFFLKPGLPKKLYKRLITDIEAKEEAFDKREKEILNQKREDSLELVKKIDEISIRNDSLKDQLEEAHKKSQYYENKVRNYLRNPSNRASEFSKHFPDSD